MIALLTSHLWPLWLAIIGVVAVGVAFPHVSLPALRWIVGTEPGRALLLVAAVAVAAWWFSASRFAAGRAAERREWEARMVEQAMRASQDTIRAAQLSAKASDDARASGADRAKTINDSRQRAEGWAREPRAPGSNGCPAAADPRIVRESEEAAGRITATEDRLRGFRAPDGDRSGASGAR